MTKDKPLLDTIFIDGTGVDDQFLGQLEPISKIGKITVGNTHITSKAFPQFAKFSFLHEIWLNDLDLTDADMAKLPPLPKLTRFKLDNNPRLTDACIAGILAKCPALEFLTVRNCPLITNKCLPYISHSGVNRFAAYGTKVTADGNKTKRKFLIELSPVRNPGSKADLKK